MTFLKTIWGDILKRQNLDVYVTVSLTIGIAILGILGITTIEVISAAILGVLGLVSISLLQNRREDEQLREILGKVDNKFSAEDYLNDRTAYPPLQETLVNARCVCFMGPSLLNIFSSWGGYLLEEKMRKYGTKIQALLIDPDGPGVNSMEAYFRHPLAVDIERDIKRTLSTFDVSHKKGTMPNLLEVRLMPIHPHISMVIINPDDDDGKMFIEFIDFEIPLHALPHMELTRQRDGRWYEYFLSHYRRTWDGAKVYTISPEQKIKKDA
jgi:hypothetical protein